MYPAVDPAVDDRAPRRRTPPPPVPPARTGGPSGQGPQEPRRREGNVFGRVIAAALAMIVLVATGVGWFINAGVSNASGQSNAPTAAGSEGVAFEGGMNILLVGSDARTDAQGNPLTEQELRAVATEASGGLNTDTIMVLHVPEGGGRATAVSLPRDTWIGQDIVTGLPGPYSDGGQGDYQPNKINAFYGTARAFTLEALVQEGVEDAAERERRGNEAGRVMLTKVVQKFSGLKIHHYAEVNLLGFYLLSTAIGGVPVCLNAPVDDPFSGAKFEAGQQTVEGTAALSFVRQRHGLPQGDLDRVRRQQAFLSGAADKILSAGTLTSPSKLTALVDAVGRSVVFDKEFDLLSFAQQMQSLSAGNVDFVTIPTTGASTETNKDALATDPQQIAAFFANLDGGQGAAPASPTAPPTVNPAAVTVDVQNGTNTNGMATAVGEKVVAGGFQRGQVGDYPGDAQQTTTVRYPAGDEHIAAAVLKAIGNVGSTQQDDDVTAGHVLVVVGTDMPAPGSGLRAAVPFAHAPAVAAPAGAACVN